MAADPAAVAEQAARHSPCGPPAGAVGDRVRD